MPRTKKVASKKVSEERDNKIAKVEDYGTEEVKVTYENGTVEIFDKEEFNR